ncbi:helix-turn-helix domain-containing protein [Halolamina sp. CBA1230]|uniref:helix-turn-helix domain-containing protein n=1 Tax=Halolamina sp. CBA1230 TaxID=1853690 RepID=UPI0009A247A8|nr:helix-turn-helix domain-containing protein [Halolamina sp. CBA1230]QKY21003.1 helix-turn-helix domain-containing protein [Halolamina sp. CBA1230]
MSLIAELRVAGKPFALSEALGAAPGMRAETEYSVSAPAGPVVFAWVWGGDFDAFESALPEDSTVEAFELIEDDGDRRLYQIVLADVPALIDPGRLHRRASASQLRIVTGPNYSIVTERLPDRESLAEYIRLCREHGYDVDLLRAHPPEEEHAQYDLSEKQVDALGAALAAGYFETPRRTDLDTLAEEFDISEQALSERLRRGVAAVLESTIGELYEPPGDERADTPGTLSG